ncbi:hypothetical protein BSKO_07067 [Bryopsis sp. KO-2023]|nr:hypothetical protein BSKO_07067 [Bryopsis sp. KO-2023]
MLLLGQLEEKWAKDSTFRKDELHNKHRQGVPTGWQKFTSSDCRNLQPGQFSWEQVPEVEIHIISACQGWKGCKTLSMSSSRGFQSHSPAMRKSCIQVLLGG